MSNTEIEARPRPLSAGLWTLFSWLRRDERSASSESLSSAGSDRTAASFAFLAPAHYRTAPSGPCVLPPPGPPTDSYKRRVQDRNLRRQHDRDLTLHRKYGLFKTDYDAFSLPPVRRANSDIGNKWDRERRATSECLPRRAVHVPGKRRAPAPPGRPGAPASIPRPRARKRPAPQPPNKLTHSNNNNSKPDINPILIQMNTDAVTDRPTLKHNDVTMDCKPEKYSKKESSGKDVKVRSERSFLKQMFDSKKRNSAIETSAIKILPSISELDKQAAEIIESCKLRGCEPNNNVRCFPMTGAHASGSATEAGSWFCVNCLRKYNPSVTSCLYCISAQRTRHSETNELGNSTHKGSNFTQTEKVWQNLPSSSKNSKADEKLQLRKMLKEMKDSLPKKPKHEANERVKIKHKIVKLDDRDMNNYPPSETPTLRVGSTIQNKTKLLPETNSPSFMKKSSTEAVLSTHVEFTPVATQNAVVTHHVVLAHNRDEKNVKIKTNENATEKHPANSIRPESKVSNIIMKKEDRRPGTEDKLHTPLRISSLLNPVYIPKDKMFENSPKELNPSTELKISKLPVAASNDMPKKIASVSTNTPSSSSGATTSGIKSKLLPPSKSGFGYIQSPVKEEITNHIKNDANEKHAEKITKPDIPHISASISELPPERKLKKNVQNSLQTSPDSSRLNESTTTGLAQHIRRRTLINQLEQSIAKGDERAAAEAAAKLAQLRLSCSVLSYSSQILANASTSTNNVSSENTETKAKVANLSSSYPTEKLVELPNAKVEIKTTDPEKNHGISVLPSSSKVSKDVVQKIEDPIGPKPVLDQPSTSTSNPNSHMISIAVLVEDREATRGPIQLRIRRQANLRELRQAAQASLGLAAPLQRWIIGRALCTDDAAPVASLAGTDCSAPFYLCIVEAESKLNTATSSKQTAGTNLDPPETTLTTTTQTQGGDVYTELVKLEQQALVPNTERFECGVCTEEYGAGEGVVLRECVHTFCRECLAGLVRHCAEPRVACPAAACRGALQEREVRALVPAAEHARWLARGLAAAESGARHAFHCRTADCAGWALAEPPARRFPCPVCRAINCIPCQAIHEGETCEQYQAKLKETSNPDQADEGTKALLNSLIRRGEALECPECKAIIMKKWGCDWVKCSACKTEICWVTRGRRWGPGGRGDTSAGCRCGVDGKKCHPSCGYCH